MPKSIINIADVSLDPTSPDWAAATGHLAEDFAAKTGAISARIGARKLGYNITAVPPGKRAAPFHNHPAKEEMFFVLQGSGDVRIGEARYPIRKGDIIACLEGGKETAHQIINTGHGRAALSRCQHRAFFGDGAVSGFGKVCSGRRGWNRARRDAAASHFHR
jgi:uncharacterized cupin superfamily protein